MAGIRPCFLVRHGRSFWSLAALWLCLSASLLQVAGCRNSFGFNILKVRFPPPPLTNGTKRSWSEKDPPQLLSKPRPDMRRPLLDSGSRNVAKLRYLGALPPGHLPPYAGHVESEPGQESALICRNGRAPKASLQQVHSLRRRGRRPSLLPGQASQMTSAVRSWPSSTLCAPSPLRSTVHVG